MKYLLIEDPACVDRKFIIFAIDNDTKYIFRNVYWSAAIQELLLDIKHARLYQSNFHDDWLNCIVASFDEIPTLSYVEQHYPERLI